MVLGDVYVGGGLIGLLIVILIIILIFRAL